MKSSKETPRYFSYDPADAAMNIMDHLHGPIFLNILGSIYSQTVLETFEGYRGVVGYTKDRLTKKQYQKIHDSGTTIPEDKRGNFYETFFCSSSSWPAHMDSKPQISVTQISVSVTSFEGFGVEECDSLEMHLSNPQFEKYQKGLAERLKSWLSGEKEITEYVRLKDRATIRYNAQNNTLESTVDDPSKQDEVDHAEWLFEQLDEYSSGLYERLKEYNFLTDQQAKILSLSANPGAIKPFLSSSEKEHEREIQWVNDTYGFNMLQRIFYIMEKEDIVSAHSRIVGSLLHKALQNYLVIPRRRVQSRIEFMAA
jgi:hypothetical protein